jgi:hypothetical protein
LTEPHDVREKTMRRTESGQSQLLSAPNSRLSRTASDVDALTVVSTVVKPDENAIVRVIGGQELTAKQVQEFKEEQRFHLYLFLDNYLYTMYFIFKKSLLI